MTARAFLHRFSARSVLALVACLLIGAAGAWTAGVARAQAEDPDEAINQRMDTEPSEDPAADADLEEAVADPDAAPPVRDPNELIEETDRDLKRIDEMDASPPPPELPDRPARPAPPPAASAPKPAPPPAPPAR